MSYLPLSHIAAQIYDLWTGIQWGELVYFAQPDALKVGAAIIRVNFLQKKIISKKDSVHFLTYNIRVF